MPMLCRLICSTVLLTGPFAGALWAQAPAEAPQAGQPDTPPAETAPETTDAARSEPETEPASEQDELLSRAKELGSDTVKAVDRSETVKKATDALVEGSEKVTEQASPAWHFAAYAIGFAAIVSFVIQLVGKAYVIAKFRYLDVKEVLSDALSLVTGLIAVAFVLRSGEAHGVLVTSGSTLGGATLLGAIMGIALGIWGVRQEVESCRTAEVLEELAETKAEYGRLRRKAEKMSYSGKKLLEEKRRRESRPPTRT